jgi:metal-dependent hydrolase (beta-lactamase superfamily II)
VTFALQQLIPSIWANENFGRRANSLANTNLDALSIEHNQVDHSGGDEWLAKMSKKIIGVNFFGYETPS